MRVWNVLGSLVLALCLLLGCFFILEKSEFLYQWLVEGTGVYDEEPLPPEVIRESVRAIHQYMNHKRPDLLVFWQGKSLFRAQEIFHMFEVRGIFDRLWGVFLLLLSGSLLALWRLPRRKLLRGQFLAMISVGFFFLIAGSFFERAFLLMHEWLFDNPYWAFSAEHWLIRILREEFFLGFMILCALMAFGVSGLFFFFGRKEIHCGSTTSGT